MYAMKTASRRESMEPRNTSEQGSLTTSRRFTLPRGYLQHYGMRVDPEGSGRSPLNARPPQAILQSNSEQGPGFQDDPLDTDVEKPEYEFEDDSDGNQDSQDVSANDSQQGTQSAPSAPKVSSVTVIADPSLAISGFPAVPSGADLNKPGLFNDTQTGTFAFVNQVLFRLSKGKAAEVGLTRLVDRTGYVTIEGKRVENKKSGNDGPSAPTVIRPSGNEIAVADSPGLNNNRDGKDVFPARYKGDFKLYAFDIISNNILASAFYSIEVDKTSKTQASPMSRMSVTATKIF